MKMDSFDTFLAINLFQMNPFSFKTEISTNNLEIDSINSWFDVNNHFNKRIEEKFKIIYQDTLSIDL